MISDYYIILYLLCGASLSFVYMMRSCRDGPYPKTGVVLFFLWGVAIPYWILKMCLFGQPENNGGDDQ